MFLCYTFFRVLTPFLEWSSAGVLQEFCRHFAGVLQKFLLQENGVKSSRAGKAGETGAFFRVLTRTLLRIIFIFFFRLFFDILINVNLRVSEIPPASPVPPVYGVLTPNFCRSFENISPAFLLHFSCIC